MFVGVSDRVRARGVATTTVGGFATDHTRAITQPKRVQPSNRFKRNRAMALWWCRVLAMIVGRK